MIQPELLKPKKIRIFDHRKWTNNYILDYELGRNKKYGLPRDITDEGIKEWKKTILIEIDKSFIDKEKDK